MKFTWIGLLVALGLSGNAFAPMLDVQHVDAAIFSDGHVEGDPRALADIYWARQGAYKALAESTKLLSSIHNGHQSVERSTEVLSTQTPARLNEKTEAAWEDGMNATGLSRDQAPAVAFGKRLEQWKSLLQDNLPPHH